MELSDLFARGIGITTPAGTRVGDTADDLDDDMVTRFIQQVLAVGIDGRGPYASASDVAARALERHGSTEAAVDAVVRSHLVTGTAAGFLTSVGERVFSRLGKAIPVLGGGIGAALDATMLNGIAAQARQEFPPAS